jgi:hypothetical protein
MWIMRLNLKFCVLACGLLLPTGSGAEPESVDMTLVTKVRLSDCCIEYQGLITSEANDGVYEFYRDASPKPTTLIIESHGGSAGAAMELGNWMLDHELDVRVDTYCYSSCANYVFLAGENKMLASHASLMWHGGVMQPMERPKLEHVLDDMLGALDPEAREEVLAERSRERLLEQLEASRLELIAREAQFFQRIGVDPRLTILGQLFEHELLAHDHDYDGWDLSVSDLEKLGVHGIQIVGDGAWEPWPARENLQVFRIRLEALPDFAPRLP